MTTITEEYVRKHPTSAERYSEAREIFPGGVTHDTRYVTPFPLYITHGSGPLKWDVDGNEYVDYVSGHGALILGHSHPEIEAAVSKQMARGTHLGSNTEEELRWARAIKQLMPSVEKLRFHSSGTEATLMAFRLARAYTGKDKIIKFQDHFHGWHDYGIAGSVHPTAGVPQATRDTMVVLSVGDVAAVERVLSQDNDIAAVVLEPTGAHWGQQPFKLPHFLQELREVTSWYDVLLIFDEVVTGFRVSPGGAQERFGVTPDLTAMAKIVAGGLPGGAVGGKGEIVDMIAFRGDPEWDSQRRVSHPGTFNANPLSAVAGATCLELIASQPINQKADAMAARLKDGLNEVLGKVEVPGHSHGIASMVHVTLGKDCDCDREVCTMSHQQIKEAMRPAITQALKCAMLNAGVDLMGGRGFLVSATHREEEVDFTVGAFEEAIKAMRAEGIV